MSVFTPKIKLAFVSSQDKIEKWSDPINDNFIILDALGAEILAAMTPYGSLREAIEKNAGTNVDATKILFPDGISLPDVADGIKRPITSVIQQLANNKMSIFNPTVGTGQMTLLAGNATTPSLKFGDVFSVYIDTDKLVLAKSGVKAVQVTATGLEVEETQEFVDKQVVNFAFLRDKGLQAHWAGAGLKFTGSPTQYLEVIGNNAKAIRVDPTNGVEMFWDTLSSDTLVKLDNLMVIQDPVSKQFKTVTKNQLFGNVIKKNYQGKYDPVTGFVTGDPLNTVLNPAGPAVVDGEHKGNVSYIISKNGVFKGKNVYAGQEVYWNVEQSSWMLKAEYVRLTSFTGANGTTYTGDYLAAFGQYVASMIQLDPQGMQDVAPTSQSVQQGISDLASNKFSKAGGTLTGTVTARDIVLQTGYQITIPDLPTVATDGTNKKYVDDKFALKNGDSSLTFKVSSPVANADAVNLSYFNSSLGTALNDYYTKTVSDGRFAALAGLSTQQFNVAAPTTDNHAVTLKFANDKYALKQGDNTLVFKAAVPIANDDVVTKKYMEENVITGQSAGKGLKFTPNAGQTPTLDVDIVENRGLGFDTTDKAGKLILDYANLTQVPAIRSTDMVMIYDSVSQDILKISKNDFLGTLAQSIRLRGSWNPNTNVVNGDLLNETLVAGQIAIQIYTQASPYPKGSFVYYAPVQPTWNLANSYLKGDKVTKSGQDYIANDDIPANTPFVEGTTGATWSSIDLYATYKSQVVTTAGPFNPTEWTKVSYEGKGPVGLFGDDTTGFAYSIQADKTGYDLNDDGVLVDMLAGDQVVWTGSAWILVPDAQAVKSVFGRTGVVIAANGDYNAGQITYTRASGKKDIAGSQNTVLLALNDLDDKKVSLSLNQTIAGNKTFSGSTSFNTAPKVPQMPLTPANDDLVTKAYVVAALAAGNYVTRTYTATGASPVNWNLGGSLVLLNDSDLQVTNSGQIALIGSEQSFDTASTLSILNDSVLNIGTTGTAVGFANIVHNKGAYNLKVDARINASGKINILYTPSDADDAVPKGYVDNLVTTQAANSYTKTEQDAKYYLKTGGHVDGWGSFKATSSQSNSALFLKAIDGTDSIRFRTVSQIECGISGGDGQSFLTRLANDLYFGISGGTVDVRGRIKANANIITSTNGLFSTDSFTSVAGDSNIAMSSKVIGGKLYAGLWGHTLSVVDSTTSANLLEANQFLINSDTWELKGKRFNISTTEGAHCAVVPTEDTHLVNKKFLDGKLILDSGPADGKQYVRKNGAWSEIIVPTPLYWSLPDLPQKLKDIVGSASSDNDATTQHFYAGLKVYGGTSGGANMLEIMKGVRGGATSAVGAFRYSNSRIYLSSNEGFHLNATTFQNVSAGTIMTISGATGTNIQSSQVGGGVNINNFASTLVGTTNTVITLKGGNGGTDQRLLKLQGDVTQGDLEFNPGTTLFDGLSGRQIQLIPNGQATDALYHDMSNGRWNFRKTPRMATDALNVTPTQPEEFITKKHLDSVTASLVIKAGLEGQVYTMGATAWSGKFPQYLGAVKEADSVNRIKIDDDTAGGKILILGSSARDGSFANSAKNIEIRIAGSGTETADNARSISLINGSKDGSISLNSAGSISSTAASWHNITAKSMTIQTTNPVAQMRLQSAYDIQLGNDSQYLQLNANLTWSNSDFSYIVNNAIALAPRDSGPTYWSILGKTSASGTCLWDEFGAVGIQSQHGTGVQISAVPATEWSDASVSQWTKRANRKGYISLNIPDISSATAAKGNNNGIFLTTQNTNGQISLDQRGSGGFITLKAGLNTYSGMIHSTLANINNGIEVAQDNYFRVRAAGELNMSGNTGLQIGISNGTSGWQGLYLSKTSAPNDCFRGFNPTQGSNIIVRPQQSTTYDGNCTQLGAPQAAQMRFAGLFVRGLDIGEGGSLTTTNAENGRGIAMVGATPKWAAAQSSAVSDHYPRGGILIGIRGDGAETSSDARRIQVINESNNGRIDIYAQPNIANGNNSTINIIQGKSAASSPNAGIRIAGSSLVEIASVDSNVTIQAQAAGSSFAVNVGSEAQPQILVTKTTTTIRNLQLGNVAATLQGNTGNVASFSANVVGGAFASQFARKAAYHAEIVTTGSQYAPHSTMRYSHNGSFAGQYSLGVLNTNTANPGQFVIHHIDSVGGNARQMTWSPSSGTLYSDVISTSSVTATGAISGISLQAGGSGITSTGTVQINNSNPTLWLQDTDHKGAAIHVNSNTCYILRSAAVNGTSWDNGPNDRFPMTLSLDTGDVVFSGNVTAYSDIRLKRDVQDLSYGLKEIMKLRPISYKRVGTDTDRLEVGFIAQEVRDVIPEIVHEQQDDQKTLTMSYDKMVAPLVRAIQEQQDMINKLMSRVEELEKGGV